MAGAFEWLDNLTTQVGAVAGKAVDYAGQVAVTNAAVQAARTQNDQTAVKPASVLQASGTGGISPWVWVAGAGVLALGVVLLLRRR
jgi:hypothetical protein